ncbi:hypothetical protein [Micromonospora sp. WMMD736]|uniref:hypothetical protein n=1 Tax=Micromonospora sp. WMMD736 TaxID=3404112 RepID=UPI003B9282D4
MTRHGPTLPLWLCVTCDRPWPCLARREELRGEYAEDSCALKLYMGMCLASARQDMSWARPEALRLRFLGWVP